MDKLLPISVNISILNEEQHIFSCIENVLKNRPKEIIVIDAGSTDKTLSIIEKNFPTVRVLKCEAKGLAYQRQQGIDQSTQPFIAIVDAQDNIEDNCLEILFDEMNHYQWKAIQAQTFAKKIDSYWEKAYEFTTTLSINEPGPSNMVGRPCIYEAQAIREVGFDPFFGFGVGCEDTDISIQFEKKALGQGMGSGKVFRNHPKTFNVWFSKWIKYGKGDAHLGLKYPYKKKNILIHQLYNYPLKRGFKAVINGGIIYYPFFLGFGVIRFISAQMQIIQFKINGTKYD